MQSASGRIKEQTGSYPAMFLTAGSVYVLSVLVIHLLAPRLTPADLGETPERGPGEPAG